MRHCGLDIVKYQAFQSTWRQGTYSKDSHHTTCKMSDFKGLDLSGKTAIVTGSSRYDSYTK